MSTAGTRNFALAVVSLLALLSILGLTTVALVVGAGTSLLAGVLLWCTWPDTDGQSTGRREGERATIVRASATPLLVTFLMLAIIRIAGSGAITARHLSAYRGMTITADVTAITLFLSSLTDWCYTKPRLNGFGIIAKLPCQASTTAPWRTLTRIWLLHRIVAYAMLRIGIVGVLTFAAAATHPRLSTAEDSVAAAVAAALAIYFVNRIVTIGTLVSNPPIQVGDKITLAEEFGTGVTERPNYYVVDVAIEGVQLMELGPGDEPRSSDAERSHDRSLDLRDIGRLLRNRDRFEGCCTECCKVSKYCPLEVGETINRAAGP